MAEDEVPAEEAAEGAEGAEGEGGGKKSKKKLIIIIAAVLLLLGGGGAAMMMMGGGDAPADGEHGGEAAHGEDGEHGEAVGDHGEAAGDHGGGHGGGHGAFFDLPDLLVNLNAGGKRPAFLKLVVSLEVTNPEEASKLEALTPRIVDSFQIYLRELRIEDLEGSIGIQRLREELMRRAEKVTAPVKIKDILFRELLVQ